MQNILNMQEMTTLHLLLNMMVYCCQFGKENSKSRIGAQLEPGVVAQKQEVAAQEIVAVVAP